MRPSKARFVTLCQQLLALGVVLAVLTPATTVISLDVVQRTPHAQQRGTGERAVAEFSAYTREAQRATKVPTAPVESEVEEYQLTPATGSTSGTSGKVATGGLNARTKIGALGSTTQVVSTPEEVTGYGAVGVTWRHGEEVPADELSFDVRTLDDGTWSDWMELPYDDDHGPDPASPEGQQARPGTDVLLVGKVDEVQVRSTSKTATQPRDMRLAVIEPGKPTSTARELPEIDTDPEGLADESEPQTTEPAAPAEPKEPADPSTDEDGIELQSATFTPRPTIYSRAQWGANENLRDKGSLRYYEVHAGFVHHTVNANNYSRADVPGIIRSIYAYHTQSRGWSDVGYNFLVDKFGRIWEGRYGGVNRPVVGAHTLGYNDYSFAMSAIGNFETAHPSTPMLEAYGALFGWKLSLHGVSASSTAQRVGSKTFRAINGHRDAGSTACPGKYLYAKIPTIRALAADAQRGWAGRQLESNLASTSYPDLVVRRISDGQGFIIPTGGILGFTAPKVTADAAAGAKSVVASPDLTGDGLGDLVVQDTEGIVRLRPGVSGGGFGAAVRRTVNFVGRDMITAVGDLDEDGHNDLLARNPDSMNLNAYLGRGNGVFDRKAVSGDWSDYDKLAATGDVDRDGHVDLFARDRDGVVWRFPGNGTRTFRAPVKLPGSTWDRYDVITGFGDFSRDGNPDLIIRATGGNGYVLTGNGKGGFGRSLGPISRLKSVTSLSGGGQMMGNGAPDLVYRRGDDMMTTPHNGLFNAGRPIATGMNLKSVNRVLNAGDWDRDGHGDVVIRTTSGQLQLRQGDGKGHFATPRALSTADFNKVALLSAVGDMTGDGWPDLMGQPAGGSMRIYPGRGLNGLATSYVASSPISGSRQLGVGRWDADGAPDSLFRSGSRLTMYRGNGPGGFAGSRALTGDVTPYDWVLGISDLRRVGHPDIIVRQKSTGDLYAINGGSTGLGSKRFLASGMDKYDLAG